MKGTIKQSTSCFNQRPPAGWLVGGIGDEPQPQSGEGRFSVVPGVLDSSRSAQDLVDVGLGEQNK